MLASASKVRLKAKFDGSSQSAPTDGTVMSEVKPIHLPLSAVFTLPELDDLIERILRKDARAGRLSRSVEPLHQQGLRGAYRSFA